MADFTVERVREIKTDREKVYGDLHAHMERDATLWEATDRLTSRLRSSIRGFPSDLPIMLLPIAQYAVDNFKTGVLSGETPKVTVKVAKGATGFSGVTREECQTLMQDFSQALTEWAFHHGTTESPIVDSVDQCGAIGAGVLSAYLDKSLYPKPPAVGKTDENAWKRYEMQRKTTIPFEIRSIPPRNVMWDLEHDPPRDVIVVEKVSAQSMAARYPDIAAERGWLDKGAEREIERIEYQSDEDVCVLVDDWPVEGPKQNPWGRQWIAVALSGLGKQSWDYDPAVRVQGVLRRIHDMVIETHVVYNTKIALRQKRGFPGVDFEGTDDAEKERTRGEYEDGPGAKNIMYGDTKAVAQPVAQIPEWFFSLDEDNRRFLEMAVGTPSQRGAYQTDNATVNAQNLDRAISLWQIGGAALEQQWAQCLMNLFHQIKMDMESDQDLYLPGMAEDGLVMINPDYIPETGLQITVDYAPPTLQERAAQLQTDQALLESGAIDMDEFRRRQGIDDGETIDYRRKKRTLAESTFITEVAAKVAAQRIEERFALAEESTRVKSAGRGVIQPREPQRPEPSMNGSGEFLPQLAGARG